MVVTILPTVFPVQWMFTAFLVCSVIVWGATIGAREVFAFARSVSRQKVAKAAAVAVVVALMLAYATASEATTIIRCDWPCWWW